MFFWCETKSKLAPGLHRDSKKRPCLSNPLTGWFNSIQALEATTKTTENFCVCSEYLFGFLIDDIAYASTFKLKNHEIYPQSQP